MKVHVRRVGVTAGFLFGFGLLTVVLASNASAEEQERTELTAVLSPVGSLLEPAAPVVRSGTELLAPVVRPVTEAVAPLTEPVLRPVVEAVNPLLDTVSPVTEPLVGPLLRAAEPVIEPVADATGLTEAVSEVSGERSEVVVPSERALPVPVAVPSPSPAPVPMPTPVPAPALVADEAALPAAPVVSVPLMGTGTSGDTPAYPVGPVNDAALGTGGSTAGSGGSHGADAAVSAPGSQAADNKGSSRSPPGTIAGEPWFGYDDRDYPS